MRHRGQLLPCCVHWSESNYSLRFCASFCWNLNGTSEHLISKLKRRRNSLLATLARKGKAKHRDYRNETSWKCEQWSTSILRARKQLPAETDVNLVYLPILEKLQRQPRKIWPQTSRKEWSKAWSDPFYVAEKTSRPLKFFPRRSAVPRYPRGWNRKLNSLQ